MVSKFLPIQQIVGVTKIERNFGQKWNKDLKGRQLSEMIGHHWKVTSKEDNHRRSEPYRKTGRRHHINSTSQEDNITKKLLYKMTGRKQYWKMNSPCLANQSCTELGPTQPQLVLSFLIVSFCYSCIVQNCSRRNICWYVLQFLLLYYFITNLISGRDVTWYYLYLDQFMTSISTNTFQGYLRHML